MSNLESQQELYAQARYISNQMSTEDLQYISNEDLYGRTNSLPIRCQTMKHRMTWLGHVLRMPQDHIPRVALR